MKCKTFLIPSGAIKCFFHRNTGENNKGKNNEDNTALKQVFTRCTVHNNDSK